VGMSGEGGVGPWLGLLSGEGKREEGVSWLRARPKEGKCDFSHLLL